MINTEEIRKARKKQLVSMLLTIAKIMIDNDAIQEGKKTSVNYSEMELRIPIKAADFFTWEEILNQ